MQVNASPSLSADTKDDYTLKKGLLEDTFGIVEMGLLGKDQGFSRVGGFDLLWNDGTCWTPRLHSVEQHIASLYHCMKWANWIRSRNPLNIIVLI